MRTECGDFAGYCVKIRFMRALPKSKKRRQAKGIGQDHIKGEDVRAEVHWFREETAGQVKHMIRIWIND